MKTVIAISLSFLVLFQSAGFSMVDISELKMLWDHADYHTQEHGDDFYTFLDKHYGSLKFEHLNNHEEEQSKHEKLPFQHGTCQNLVIAIISYPLDNPFGKPMVSKETVFNFNYNDLYSFQKQVSFFEPPKLA